MLYKSTTAGTGSLVLILICLIPVLGACGGTTAVSTTAPAPASVVTTLAASQTTSPASATTAAQGVATTVQASATTVQVAATIASGTAGTDNSPGAYTLVINGIDREYQSPTGLQPKSGYGFMAVDVTIISQSNTAVVPDPNSARIFDASNEFYNPIIKSGKQPILPTMTSLPKGQTARGWVTVEVPIAQKNFKLEYNGHTSKKELLPITLAFS